MESEVNCCNRYVSCYVQTEDTTFRCLPRRVAVSKNCSRRELRIIYLLRVICWLLANTVHGPQKWSNL